MKHDTLLLLMMLLLVSCKNNNSHIGQDKDFLSLHDELKSHIVSISRDGELLDIKFSMRLDDRSFIPYSSTETIIDYDEHTKRYGNDDCHYSSQNTKCYFQNITSNIDRVIQNLKALKKMQK